LQRCLKWRRAMLDMPSDNGVPPLVHFIFGLSDDPEQRRFSYPHYLAVCAAHARLQPSTLLLHYSYVPTGVWWEATVGMLSLRQVQVPRAVFGRPLTHAAHRADVLRLQLLIEFGGIYLDLDVITLRPFAPLVSLLTPEASFLIGREGHPAHGGFHGLCNAVLIARPNASFARRWLEQYVTFGSSSAGDEWAGLSVHFPVKLAAAHAREVLLVPHTAFFWPDWDESSLQALLLLASEDFTPTFVAIETDVVQEWAPQPSGGSMLGRAVRALTGSAHGNGLPWRASSLPAGPAHSASGLWSHSALRSRYAVHLWTRLSSDYVLSAWTAEYLHTVRSSLNLEMAKIAVAPAWLLQAETAATSGGMQQLGGWRLDASGRRTLSHAPTPRRGLASPMAFWPLRPAAHPRSALLLEDISGGHSHGWIYCRSCEAASPPTSTDVTGGLPVPAGQFDTNPAGSSAAEGVLPTSGAFTAQAPAGGCWAQAGPPPANAAEESLEPAPGLGFSLVYSDPLEGFVPLPPAPAAAFSVSWYARHEALADGCGGGANWWALSFGQGKQLIAGARTTASGHLAPVLLETAGARPRVLAGSGHASVCNNGWHHYLVSISGPRREALLYVDGVESARGRWSHATILPRGLWIGTSEVAISARTLSVTKLDGRRLSSLAKLALFADAVHPGQLAPEYLAGPLHFSSHTGAAQVESSALARPVGPSGSAAVIAPTSDERAAWTPEPVDTSRLAGWASVLLSASAPLPSAHAPTYDACTACDGLWSPVEPRILPASLVPPVVALGTLIFLACLVGPMLAAHPLMSRLLRRGVSPGYKPLPQSATPAASNREAALHAVEIGPWRLALRRRQRII
jgi:hypothetical protein